MTKKDRELLMMFLAECGYRMALALKLAKSASTVQSCELTEYLEDRQNHTTLVADEISKNSVFREKNALPCYIGLF